MLFSGGIYINLVFFLREEVFRRRSSFVSLRRFSVSVGIDDLSMDYDDGEVVEFWFIRIFFFFRGIIVRIKS